MVILFDHVYFTSPENPFVNLGFLKVCIYRKSTPKNRLFREINTSLFSVFHGKLLFDHVYFTSREYLFINLAFEWSNVFSCEFWVHTEKELKVNDFFFQHKQFAGPMSWIKLYWDLF